MEQTGREMWLFHFFSNGVLEWSKLWDFKEFGSESKGQFPSVY